ncbi:MAG: hypothetical protein A3C50_01225 [Candidatus Staskawiczbacteria bacterium RIFCSPHIGHO2_02_FULL_43_16]|uniref:Uncharacterized protein n=1 Tax=Candidatus Staskawiczbacteria bacterium RIFCSPHIGHO2_01_FULL_41_41 TaxID=1802203 RepID=A0A1G2HV97_9BACT|nr:MAG: hypothetical protein A2822_04690 [Candidatus Staskawiczbacteria bacterium RIFCSPHIGHO2_01_FULL_41_41]OGZ68830.1 MAG: hypothetical protein A3C50_01225 [Candidatus Staskawiczbacteria bacterium RIFCSPHIGHO2_02_FULL_43_16]OGZ74203.1 MAG: hypothetical protein A3A12_00215 [Candidatus Staskawiczbacteria bacterium RIFCSPLOWO2_01_FULL_43_17b]
MFQLTIPSTDGKQWYVIDGSDSKEVLEERAQQEPRADGTHKIVEIAPRRGQADLLKTIKYSVERINDLFASIKGVAGVHGESTAFADEDPRMCKVHDMLQRLHGDMNEAATECAEWINELVERSRKSA